MVSVKVNESRVSLSVDNRAIKGTVQVAIRPVFKTKNVIYLAYCLKQNLMKKTETVCILS